jgi:hypothetical protein
MPADAPVINVTGRFSSVTGKFMILVRSLDLKIRSEPAAATIGTSIPPH